MLCEQRAGLRGKRGVLDPRVGEGIENSRVERRVRGQLHRRVAVVALEIHDPDGAGGGDVLKCVCVPGERRVELELECGVALQTRAEWLERWWLTQADRGHEADWSGGPAERGGEREPGLPQS